MMHGEMASILNLNWRLFNTKSIKIQICITVINRFGASPPPTMAPYPPTALAYSCNSLLSDLGVMDIC